MCLTERCGWVCGLFLFCCFAVQSFDMSFFNNLRWDSLLPCLLVPRLSYSRPCSPHSVHGIFLSFMIMELFVTRAQFYFRHLLVAFVVSCIYMYGRCRALRGALHHSLPFCVQFD